MEKSAFEIEDDVDSDFKKVMDNLEKELLRKEAEIKDLNFKIERQHLKFEDLLKTSSKKDSENKQLIERQREEISKLEKDNEELKNLVEYLKEENTNLNELIIATQLGNWQKSCKDVNNLIVPDSMPVANIKREIEECNETRNDFGGQLDENTNYQESFLPAELNGITMDKNTIALASTSAIVGNGNTTSSNSAPGPQSQPRNNNGFTKLGYFTCEMCNFNTNSKEDFLVHNVLHTGMCDQCNFSSTNPRVVATHRVKNHSFLQSGQQRLRSVRLLKCDACDFAAKSVSSLTRHKSDVHANQGVFQRVQCDFTAISETTLLKHAVVHGVRERPFPCDQCHLSFKHKHILNAHRKTHQGDKPFKCDECEYGTSKKGNLIVHKRTHTGERPFSCDYCGYSFKVRSDLTRHVKRMHTGQRAKRGAPSKRKIPNNAVT